MMNIFTHRVFLIPSLKTNRANLNGAFSSFSLRTFVNFFQWIPSLLINPASFLLITIAGTVSFLLPFCKKAWQMIHLG